MDFLRSIFRLLLGTLILSIALFIIGGIFQMFGGGDGSSINSAANSNSTITTSSEPPQPTLLASVDYTLYETPRNSNEKVIGNTLAIGQKYVIYFDANFPNIVRHLGNEVEITMTVELGVIDDHDVNYSKGKNRPEGGLAYQIAGEGAYFARVIVEDGKAPALKKTPFYLNVTSESGKLETVRLNFYVNGEQLLINNQNEFRLNLNFVQYKVDFSIANLTQYHDFTGLITVPPFVPRVYFNYYSEARNAETYIGGFYYQIDGDAEESAVSFDYADHLASLEHDTLDPTELETEMMRERIVDGEFSNYSVRIIAMGHGYYESSYFEYLPFVSA